MRTIAIWTITTFLLSAPIAAAADDPAAIVDKAIKAIGGEEKLSKHKAEQWKTKGMIEIMGMKMAYTADYYFQKPNQMRFDVAMEFGGMKIAISAATDGKIAWEKSGDMVREMDEKKGKAFRDNVYTMELSYLLPLKEKDCTLVLADEVKVDGKDAVGVKVSRKGQRDVVMYFDKKTRLLAKTVSTIWDEFTDKEVMQESILSKWKDIGGMMYFEKLVIMRGGKDFITEEFSDQKSMEKLDPKLFAKP
jgi:hypothetical protein